MPRQSTRSRTATAVLIAITLCFGLAKTLFAAAFEPVAPSDSRAEPSELRIQSVREAYGMTTDFTAAVGTPTSSTAFYVECLGYDHAEITITDDSPEFVLMGESTRVQQCGSIYELHFIFTPTMPGIVVANVTFTSEFGLQRAQLIGNGVPREQTEYWTADLGAGVLPFRIIYDNRRNLLYMSDYHNDEVVAFSPAQRRVVRRIAVGADPAELSITQDGRKLYVANSGEPAISMIDLESWESAKFRIPTLYPNPSGYQHYYFPFAIAVFSDTLALLGSRPPGYASGGPLYQWDLRTNAVTLRDDFVSRTGVAYGAYPVFKTSYDYSTVGMVVEPGASPTTLGRFDGANNAFVATEHNIERNIAVNNNGTRFISTFIGVNSLIPNLTLFDNDLQVLAQMKLLGVQSVAVAFNPARPRFAYALEDRAPILEEVRVDLRRESRALSYEWPVGYYPVPHSLAVSPDGAWVYAALLQVGNEPQGKLLAVRVGSQGAPDYVAPVSEMKALPPEQTRNWWKLSWTGSDDLSGIDHYAVEYRMGENNAWKPALTTTDTDALFIGATPGQRYDFRVYGVDRAGNIERYPDGPEVTTIAGPDTSGLNRVFLPQVESR